MQRAIGEGFGDLLATMYYLDRGDGPFLSTRRFCFGDWDATTSNPVNGGALGSGWVRWINGREEFSGGDIGIYPGGAATRARRRPFLVGCDRASRAWAATRQRATR